MFITINDRFSCSRDSYGWTLTETSHKIRTKDKAPEPPRKGWKKGDAYTTTHQTYYSTLEQVCKAILDKSMDTCRDVEGVIYSIEFATTEIQSAILRAGMK